VGGKFVMAAGVADVAPYAPPSTEANWSRPPEGIRRVSDLSVSTSVALSGSKSMVKISPEK
jgi:hypothetical protein